MDLSDHRLSTVWGPHPANEAATTLARTALSSWPPSAGLSGAESVPPPIGVARGPCPPRDAVARRSVALNAVDGSLPLDYHAEPFPACTQHRTDEEDPN